MKELNEQDKKRVQWLENACQEIFKVEASYPQGDDFRRRLYSIRVEIGREIGVLRGE